MKVLDEDFIARARELVQADSVDLEGKAVNMVQMTDRLLKESLDTVMQIFCAATSALVDKGVHPESLKIGITLTVGALAEPEDNAPVKKGDLQPYCKAVAVALSTIDTHRLPNYRALSLATSIVGLSEMCHAHGMTEEMAHHLITDIWRAQITVMPDTGVH
jgi:hypothetical protein